MDTLGIHQPQLFPVYLHSSSPTQSTIDFVFLLYFKHINLLTTERLKENRTVISKTGNKSSVS